MNLNGAKKTICVSSVHPVVAARTNLSKALVPPPFQGGPQGRAGSIAASRQESIPKGRYLRAIHS